MKRRFAAIQPLFNLTGIASTLMKLSARNTLKGKVVDLKKGPVTCEVRVDIGNDNLLTSTITTTSVEELSIEKDTEVHVVIKASNVILGVD